MPLAEEIIDDTHDKALIHFLRKGALKLAV